MTLSNVTFGLMFPKAGGLLRKTSSGSFSQKHLPVSKEQTGENTGFLFLLKKKCINKLSLLIWS